MKTPITLLSFLALAALSVLVTGQNDMTYVSNQSSKSIRASTIYHFWGSSQFTDRLITPGNYDSDVYNDYNCVQGSKQGNQPLQVEVWVDDSTSTHQFVNVNCDQSIVGYDNADSSGVDIYHAIYGTINQIDGGVQVTIYP